MSKVCRRCKQGKSLIEFYQLRKSSDGYHPECKDCCKIRRSGDRVRKRTKKSRINYRQAYRARVEHGHTEMHTIDLAKLYVRDNGVCALCKERVPTQDASMDHIVPLSKGGTHTWDNIQLVHIKCNKRKGTQPITTLI